MDGIVTLGLLPYPGHRGNVALKRKLAVEKDSSSQPQWQLVLILWGTKYRVEEVNGIIATVRRFSNLPFRAVLITDREHEGLDPNIRLVKFPQFYLREEMRGGGCQAKLVLFEKGIVPTDLPAVYIDLDTVVLGDLSLLLAEAKSERSVAIFQSAVLPIGPIGRFVARLTGGKKYARGNSSIVVYRPAECHYISDSFKRLQSEHGDAGIRPMIADERFISWCAQADLQRIPRRLAVKFPTEFMLPWEWLIRLRGKLPWVRRRWAGLLAVTLPGVEVKGQELLKMEDGSVIVDRKGRRLIWSEAAIGPMKEKLIGYYSRLNAGSEEDVA